MTDLDDLSQFGDAVVACAEVVGRAGAAKFEIGFTGPDERPRWYAYAMYRGARIQTQDHPDAGLAAMGLATQLLRGGTCRCKKIVTLADEGQTRGYCLWRLVGRRWEPGCDAPSVDIAEGQRGDHSALRKAIEEAGA